MACADVAACLDHLGVEKAGMLFMCAGAPFALSFCVHYPHRINGQLVGCSSWVSPSDCPEARLLYKLGTHVPTSVLTSAAGLISTCLRSVPTALPNFSFSSLSDVSSEDLSEDEAAFFCADHSGECKALIARLLEPMQEEAGGEGDDAAVCLAGAEAWGFDYKALGRPVALFHGEEDTTVPIECAEWLLDQLPAGSTLYRIPRGTHADVMLFGIRMALCAITSDDWESRDGSNGSLVFWPRSGRRDLHQAAAVAAAVR